MNSRIPTVVVEGASDRAAVEVVARRLGVVVEVAAAGGVTNFGPYVAGASGGLYDKPDAERVAEMLGVPVAELEAAGFFACDADLEDELLRAVDPQIVLDLAASEGDLRRFETLQQQPEWRNRPIHDQLRRWFGSGAGRKIRYARLLAEQLDLEDLPRPLASLMRHIDPASPG